MKYLASVIVLMLALGGYGQTNKKPNRPGTLSGQIVEKTFVKKNGDSTEVKELYLSCSRADYFIKICEGTVNRETLENYIGEGVTLKCEMIEGEWDSCDDNPVQSRVGTYLKVTAIMVSVKR